MLARAAERNPSVFRRAGPLCNVQEVIPKLLNICEYTRNPWGNTKFLLNQFRPSPMPISMLSKAEKKEAQERITRSKNVEQLAQDMQINMGEGKALIDQLQSILAARQTSADDPASEPAIP